MAPNTFTCTACGRLKPESGFKIQRGKYRYKMCRTCMHRKYSLPLRDLKKSYIDQYKLVKGCADCGYNLHPAALDFDHLPGSIKLFSLKEAITHSWDAIKAEIE